TRRRIAARIYSSVPCFLSTPGSPLHKIKETSKRVNLGAAPSGFGLRTVPTAQAVDRPSLALGYTTARRLHYAPRSTPNSPVPREVLPHKVPALPAVASRNVDGALSLQIPHHLRHRVLRRYRQQHVHMIDHQVPFPNLTFLVPRQFPEQTAQVLAQRPVECLASVFRDEHHMIFAFPLRMLKTLISVHFLSFLLLTLSGSQHGFSSHSRSCQTLGVFPA